MSELEAQLTTSALEEQAARFVQELIDSKFQGARSKHALLLERWWCILRYHEKSQLARRLGKVLAKRFPAVGPERAFGEVRQEDLSVREGIDWQSFIKRQLKRNSLNDDSAVQRLADRRFRFLNQELDFGPQIDWKLASRQGTPHLWRFHLHYHEFLLKFIRDSHFNQDGSLEAAWSIVEDWIQNCPIGDPANQSDAWHPFCISRRLPVWCVLWHFCPPNEALKSQILRSMYRQANFLAKNLEKDLGGNHLLENARGLAFAGVFFDEHVGNSIWQSASRILEDELPRQVLRHGEHFELSPMYHSLMLSAVLDVRDLSRSFDPQAFSVCDDASTAMLKFLESIVHPDGQIPLLGDSAFGESPSPSELKDRIAEGDKDVPNSDTTEASVIGQYWRWRDTNDYVLFDAGLAAPDHLPAHGHSDLLNLEASIGGYRLIVDSGVFDYEDSDMRNYCRSSRAHSVLQVDNEEQCDVWSKFRMGRRGKTSPLKFGVDHEFHWAAATHDAYLHLAVPELGRLVACRNGGPWIVLDWAKTYGEHSYVNRLHLGPEVRLGAQDENGIELQLPNMTLKLSLLGKGELSTSATWYCPEFGKRIARPMVEARFNGSSTCVTGWCIQKADCSQQVILESDSDDAPIFFISEQGRHTCWRPFDQL